MATTLKNFVIETQVAATAGDLFENASSEKAYIGMATFTNTNTTTEQVYVWIIDTATTATTGAGGNYLVKKGIPPGKTWICYELLGHVVPASGVIQAVTDTASRVNAVISGTLET